MKRIFSLVFACLMVLTCFGWKFTAYGDDDLFAYFTAEDVLARPGDTFTYEVYAQTAGAPVSGLIINVDFEVYRGGALTIEQMQAGPALVGAEVKETLSGLCIIWEMDANAEPALGNFLLLSLTFKSPKDVPLGIIRPSVYVQEMYYFDFEDNGTFYEFETDPYWDILGGINIIEPTNLFYVENSVKKTEYLVGEELDTAGLALQLFYNDSEEDSQYPEESEIPNYGVIITSGYTVRTNNFSASPGARKLIHIDYMGLTAHCFVDVRYPIPQVTCIKVKTNPTKTSYTTGEMFNAAGLSIEITETDGINETKRTVNYPSTGLTVDSQDMSSAGTITVTVFYGGKKTTFNITVANHLPPPGPTDITSDVRKVTATHIGKIPLGMSVPDFIKSLDQKSHIEVYKDGKQVTSGAVLTGMEVRLVVGSQVKKAKTVYVTGDVNGDGRSDITDLVQINFYILKKSTFTATQMLAANLNNDDRVDITDLVAVNFYILKKQGITAN